MEFNSLTELRNSSFCIKIFTKREEGIVKLPIN